MAQIVGQALLASIIIAVLQPAFLNASIPGNGLVAVPLAALLGVTIAFILRPALPIGIRFPTLESFLLIVLAAASEEAVWRGAVQDQLYKVSPILSWVCSIVGFALVHKQGMRCFNIWVFCLLGTVFTVANALGGLSAAITMHSVYNLTIASLIAGGSTEDSLAQNAVL